MGLASAFFLGCFAVVHGLDAFWIGSLVACYACVVAEFAPTEWNDLT
jgi:hypothetical protein